MEGMPRPKQGLSDPATAAIAWARYRRLMRWMALVAVLAIAAALAWLHHAGGLATIHMVIATIAGVGLTVLLASALMLAVFLSAGSGHDEDVASNPEDWT
jgi:phosphoglycolate phosphatase-like HAD superfamily hydrolase